MRRRLWDIVKNSESAHSNFVVLVAGHMIQDGGIRRSLFLPRSAAGPGGGKLTKATPAVIGGSRPGTARFTCTCSSVCAAIEARQCTSI